MEDAKNLTVIVTSIIMCLATVGALMYFVLWLRDQQRKHDEFDKDQRRKSDEFHERAMRNLESMSD